MEVWSSRLEHARQHIDLLSKQLIGENKRVAHLLQENNRYKWVIDEKHVGKCGVTWVG